MRHYTKRGRASRGAGGSGSFWLCYSDLMSAMLLVFVLVLFYSIYQYLDMLEVKTAELMRQSGLLDQKQVELTLKDEELTEQTRALSEKDQALKASEDKLTKSEKDLITQQAKLLLSQQELDSSEELLSKQKAELEQARAQLSDQAAELDLAKGQLAAQQATVEQQQTLLTQQQGEMSEQQQKLDALVGVRARIIASLADALRSENIRASVDQQTGSITLDASVLFDVGKSDLKDSGKEVLDQFLPVYLSVLMDPANEAKIAEIIIEGHTDTDGSYMSNLRLSQDRASSVMEYILDDANRQITGGMKMRLRKIATANGRSYSNPIPAEDGTVDKTASRRVEFKFRMHDEQMIEDMRQILERME